MADRSQTSTGLSAYVSGGLHKVLTLPANVVSKNQFCHVPFYFLTQLALPTPNLTLKYRMTRLNQ